MMRTASRIALTLTLLVAGTTFAEQPIDPLLQLLVKKGVITDAEARALQAEVAAQAPQATPAPPAASAQPAPAELPAALKGLKVGTLAYASYQDGSQNTSGGSADYSKFVLKRGYIDVRKEITPSLSARITPDIYLDSNGNTSVRMKYLYGVFQRPEFGFVGKPFVEFGMAHMPWLDFEENINRFRMQDTMFMERAGLYNSADLGFLVGGNFGPELGQEYRDTVSSAQAGKWGSFAVGLYNGGGYNASEKNSNKVLEGRLSLRPVPGSLPGLQLSVFGISGKGNVEETATVTAPDWELLAGMVSYESPRLVLTGQYEQGKGNQRGTAVDPSGMALDHDGYSFFTEVRLDAKQRFSCFGRYDHFDPSTDDPAADVTDRTIVGLAWQFAKGNFWVLDYDRLEHDLEGVDTEDRVQLTLQIKY
jgi:hypothetical protein